MSLRRLFSNWGYKLLSLALAALLYLFVNGELPDAPRPRPPPSSTPRSP